MNVVLMMWGRVQFMVWPLNYHEMDHVTGSSWAKKDVMESSPQREWTGEDDEEIHLRGKIFPYFLTGGLSALDAFEQARRNAEVHLLIRGVSLGATVLGWYVCETLHRGHTEIGPHGVGKVINFETMFARVDPPWADNYFPQVFAGAQGA